MTGPLLSALIVFALSLALYHRDGPLLALSPATAAGTADVFISEARIASLAEKVSSQTEPNFSAYISMKSEVDAQLHRSCTAPSRWSVPNFYRDRPGHEAARNALRGDANLAYQSALAYRMDGTETYAILTAGLLDCWASTITHLSTSSDSPLVWSYNFPAMLFAADLIEHCTCWPDANQAHFKTFARKSLQLATSSKSNNWGNWGNLLVLATGAYLGDSSLLDKGIARWRHFIGDQIGASNEMRHEVRRNNNTGDRGIWYSNFSLHPQTIGAEIVKVHAGMDLYSFTAHNGRTLRAAYQRIAHWVVYPDQFPYYTGAAQLPGRCYIGYFEILNAIWYDENADRRLSSCRPVSTPETTPNMTFTHGGG